MNDTTAKLRELKFAGSCGGQRAMDLFFSAVEDVNPLVKLVAFSSVMGLVLLVPAILDAIFRRLPSGRGDDRAAHSPEPGSQDGRQSDPAETGAAWEWRSEEESWSR
jgi:hypothetical protein